LSCRFVGRIRYGLSAITAASESKTDSSGQLARKMAKDARVSGNRRYLRMQKSPDEHNEVAFFTDDCLDGGCVRGNPRVQVAQLCSTPAGSACSRPIGPQLEREAVKVV